MLAKGGQERRNRARCGIEREDKAMLCLAIVIARTRNWAKLRRYQACGAKLCGHEPDDVGLPNSLHSLVGRAVPGINHRRREAARLYRGFIRLGAIRVGD